MGNSFIVNKLSFCVIGFR